MAERSTGASPDIFDASVPSHLTDEQEACKRKIYDTMSPRRRRFVNRIGYETWNPFQKPKDPLDIRTDVSGRAALQLVRLFLQEKDANEAGSLYGRGALDCALGIVNKNEKYLGIFEFCLWYDNLLRKEGHLAGHESNI